MQSDSEISNVPPESASPGTNVGPPQQGPKQIAELLLDPDFPVSAMGQSVDIGGYVGVVVDVVKQSLKVKSPEGATKSFNANGLRRIYGPRVEPPPQPTAPPEIESPASAPAFEAPKAEPVIEPDFQKPIRKIGEFVGRPDYPCCLLGEHVDVNGYTGVVVQIVSGSLKVRSQAETTRSYSADVLRKLHKPSRGE